jgi:hypothetical protein
MTILALALSLILASPFGGLFSSREAAERGRAEAKADIAAGQLILRTYGINPTGASPYARLLEERLGVKTRVVAACMVDGRIIAETAAYNEVMKREIRKRFGKDALADIERETR